MILVVFLAGYLSREPAAAGRASPRIGPIRLPPLPYLAPMVAMWAIALGIVIVQRDLGAALLFFAVFLLLLYIATGRLGYVVVGLVLFVVGRGCCTSCSTTSRPASTSGSTRSPTRRAPATRSSRRCTRSLAAGSWASGLGDGLPTIAGRPPIPAIHTDYPFAALGEELGLIGLLAILGLYLVVVERGLRIAAAGHDDFRSLLAAGLALVIGVQAFIIAAGNLKLIPLTGITLPLISYGGSSLLANAVVVGLLLALSDRGIEPPPAPRDPRRRLRRFRLRRSAP